MRDNGEPLSPEQRQRVFVPFTRLHQERAAGHGLGLVTVQRIVSKLGGTVEVRPAPDGGNEFSFTLPPARGVVRADAGEACRARSSEPAMKILHADDHAMFREGLQFFLKLLDPQVVILEASNFQAALDKLALEWPVDLALLDLQMPGMGELEGFFAVRRRFPNLPVVIISGVNDTRIIRTLLDGGARGFIPKFASSELLMTGLRHVLRGEVFVPEGLFMSADAAAGGRRRGRCVDLAPAADSAPAGRWHAQQADRRRPGGGGGHREAALEGVVQAAERAQPHAGRAGGASPGAAAQVGSRPVYSPVGRDGEPERTFAVQLTGPALCFEIERNAALNRQLALPRLDHRRRRGRPDKPAPLKER